MQKWEYKKISREMDFSGFDPMALGPSYGPMYIWQDIQDKDDPKRHANEMRRLRQLGVEGWELASVLYGEVGKKHIYTYYLKRVLE